MQAAITRLLLQRGQHAYCGEPVSQLQHALQTATLAEQSGASAETITAALLHDVGHLLVPDALTATSADHDANHESIGADWLRTWFDAAVCEPIRLHVSAKRWLCAQVPDYQAGLSAASQHSLNLQGGVFTADQASRWRSQPYADIAVMVRRWDDAAKDPEAETPSLSHFLAIAEAAVKPSLR